MTPLAIEMALHYHTTITGTDFLPGSVDTWPVSQQEIIQFFVDNDMLMVSTILCSKKAPQYIATEKLHAYCEHVCKVPLPVARSEWVFVEENLQNEA